MSDKDSNIRSTQQDESQDETQSYPMERLTSEAPPPYSEVVGHSQTANNDPASERNEQASPYQPPAVQQDISLPPVRLVSNNPTPPTRVVVVTPPQPSPDTQLLQNAVQSQVEIKLFSAVFCSLILFFLATPLSLLVTLPSIYCICKVCNNSYIGALHGNKITNAFW